jgi:2,6-dihydroxypyridine 3-monooxygenase
MMRAVVIGGSLGGLTAALVLRDQGWEVDILERNPNPLKGAAPASWCTTARCAIAVQRAGKSIGGIGLPAHRLQ